MKYCWLSFGALSLLQDLVKYHPYTLLVAASLLLFPAPALASRIESWRFYTGQNKLEFRTDQDVQPSAQLLTEPTRLVIDLPGIVLGRPSFSESVGDGAIRSVRFGQYNKTITRIVIELAPGYIIDPNQIKFRGITARQWVVQIPKPQIASGNETMNGARAPVASNPTSGNSIIVPTLPLITSGGMIQRQPSRAEGEDNAAISPNFATSAPARLATIESVQLESGGRQLVIRANQPLKYDSGWDRKTSSYRITIRPAQLAAQVKGPQLDANSPVLRVRLREEDSHTVSILVQPAAGVQIADLNQPTGQILALQLQRGQSTSTQTLTPRATIPVPSAPRSATSIPTLPQISSGKIVVVIDPGHGGPDPGAVGIGGLQEKEIVLDIGIKVASLLERQGVQAVLTRRDDIDLDLEPRVQMAEQLRASVFVSIHANAINMSRPDVSGLETYYYNSGADLARVIHSSILEGTGAPDRGVRTARFYVLRKTTMPAVLVEVGFVTGQSDATKLSDPSYRSQMAAAIARGILQYIQRMTRS
ncbi:N-acetylmuramoyl-L-alanine amidase [Leptothermofonsia sp. ETS-13]|uniref:N-acetylmuramoyl-L-alanine amidase n=1 Tax=Leptothermofonsia sp. ETS-13 TaxID=3035696 RepID=UPI003BA1E886